MGGKNLAPTKTLGISVICLDCSDLKSLDFSLERCSGHCLPFKGIICSVTNDLEPHKNQMWDENSIKQNLHLPKQGPVMTTQSLKGCETKADRSLCGCQNLVLY